MDWISKNGWVLKWKGRHGNKDSNRGWKISLEQIDEGYSLEEREVICFDMRPMHYSTLTDEAPLSGCPAAAVASWGCKAVFLSWTDCHLEVLDADTDSGRDPIAILVSRCSGTSRKDGLMVAGGFPYSVLRHEVHWWGQKIMSRGEEGRSSTGYVIGTKGGWSVICKLQVTRKINAQNQGKEMDI